MTNNNTTKGNTMNEPRIAIKGNTPIPTVKVSEPRLEIKGNTPIPWNFGSVDKAPKAPKVSPAMDIILDALSV